MSPNFLSQLSLQVQELKLWQNIHAKKNMFSQDKTESTKKPLL